MPNYDIKDFLDKMAAIESSRGQNVNHPLITKGIHAGQRAQGKYGLMPLTIADMQKRYPEETKSGDEEAIANALAQHVFNRQEGDAEKAAYAWEFGHNLYPEDVIKRNYQESDRLRKYRDLIDQQAMQDPELEKDVYRDLGIEPEDKEKNRWREIASKLTGK